MISEVNSNRRFLVNGRNQVYDYERKKWDLHRFAVERAYVKIKNSEGITEASMKFMLQNEPRRLAINRQDQVYYFQPKIALFKTDRNWDLEDYAYVRAYFSLQKCMQGSSLPHRRHPERFRVPGPGRAQRQSSTKKYWGSINHNSICWGMVLAWFKKFYRNRKNMVASKPLLNEGMQMSTATYPPNAHVFRSVHHYLRSYNTYIGSENVKKALRNAFYVEGVYYLIFKPHSRRSKDYHIAGLITNNSSERYYFDANFGGYGLFKWESFYRLVKSQWPKTQTLNNYNWIFENFFVTIYHCNFLS